MPRYVETESMSHKPARAVMRQVCLLGFLAESLHEARDVEEDGPYREDK